MNEKLQIIADNLSNPEWLLTNGIVAKEKGDYWILNYNQFSDKNEYNVLTRGLVIHKGGKIVSCPFFRFFNYGEPHAAKVNFANAEVIEKLDGSLLVISFPFGNIIWHFRSLLSSHQKDREFAVKGLVDKEESFLLNAVEPYIYKISFPDWAKDYSLIFEFISKANKIVTNYTPDQYGLYLIGARHLPTLKESSEHELDELSLLLKIRRPRRWCADSYEEVIAMMANFPKDVVYEGFVVRDRSTGERIKIKSEDYLRRHRLISKLNYRTLIPLWLKGEQGEIEAGLPESKEIFKIIEASYNIFAQKVLEVLLYWQNKNVSRKEVALGIIGKEPHEICSVVFKLLETAKTNQEVALREFVCKMTVDALIRAWKLKEETPITD